MIGLFNTLTSIKLILIQLSLITLARYCPNDEIYRLGIKSVCEYESKREVVSCLQPIKINTKAFINCRYGYSSKRNLTEQKIICTYSGWSEPPMECEDICDGTPTQVKHSPKEHWYIEMKGIDTSCPGIILNAKILLTNSNCVLKYQPDNLQLETIESDPQTLIVKAIHYDQRQLKKLNGKYHDNTLAIIELENNILYTEFVISACINFNIQPFANQKIFIEEYLDKFKSSQTLDYSLVVSPCASEHFQNASSIEFRCFTSLREIQSCDKPMLRGSIVKINCKIGYQKTNLQSSDEIKCISNGKWSQKVDHRCSFICGQLDIEKPDITPLLFNGKSIDIVNVPWHVGIYSNKTISREYEQICGGTLVHINIVISAAHCFLTDENSLDFVWNYMVACGKKLRNYTSSEEFSQFSAIKKIFIPNIYNANFYRHDIAVVLLERKLEFNDYIRPACIEWFPYGQYDVEAGKQGRVVGWGATSESQDSSSELLVIELTTLSNKQCKSYVDPKHKDEITGEKFCALGKRGESACKGDSGSGFLIKKRYSYDEDRYHLWGVVSSGINQSQHCTPNFLTTYTNVQYHQDIIQSTIEMEIYKNNTMENLN